MYYSSSMSINENLQIGHKYELIFNIFEKQNLHTLWLQVVMTILTL